MRKLCALLLCLSLIVGCFATTLVALPAAAAYENTHVNTGNMALDLVAVAQTQIGYAEQSGYTKYGDAYGNPYGDWCGYFVSWCARQAGIPTAILPNTGWADGFNDYGVFHARSSGYVPQPGDLAIYGSYDDVYHVSIVESYSNGEVWLIDGNWSNKVSHHSETVTSAYCDLAGFISPFYTGGGVTELTLMNATYPTRLMLGSSFSVSGMLYDDRNILSVTAHVVLPDGTPTGVTASAKPDSTSFNLKELDASLRFGTLSTGSYIYQILATDERGLKFWNYPFDVVSSIEFSLTGALYPTALVVGQAFSIGGTVSCDEDLSIVRVLVLDETGQTVLSNAASPRATSYNLSGLDAGISFGKLSAGRYTYRVQAISDHGSRNWDYAFTVGSVTTTTTTVTTTTTAAPDDTIQLFGAVSPPPFISAGQSVAVGGRLYCEVPIHYVDLAIYSASGHLCNVADLPDDSLYDYTALGGYLRFDDLPAGNYVFRITAELITGKKQLWDTSFTVIGAAPITVAGMRYPAAMAVGESFSPTGVLSSPLAPLTYVEVGLYQGSRCVMQSAAVPGTTTYDLQQLAPLSFSSLPAGNYMYCVVAKNAASSTTWRLLFTVGDVPMLGDYNGNGSLDMADALILFQAAAGLRPLTDAQTALSDLNFDGRINQLDARLLYQFASE